MVTNDDKIFENKTKLKDAYQQLKAANLQLKAAEQQLKATNQQLKANELQLKAANQQLKAANQQLKAQEQDLRNAHQKLINIIEFLPDATFAIDQDKKVIAWNHEIEKITGISKNEIMGKGNLSYSIPLYGIKRPILIDLFDTENHEIEKKYEYIERKGNIIVCKVFLPCLRQGKGMYVLATTGPLLDENGKQVGAIETIHDITARKQAEEELNFQAMLLDQIQDHVVATDLQGNITYVNSAVVKWMGLQRENIIGSKIDIIGKNTKLGAPQKEILKKTLLGYWQGEIIKNTPEGEEFIFDCKTYSVYDSTGKRKGLSSVSRDITQFKHNEKKMVEYQHQLQCLVSQLAIAQEQERKRIAAKLHDDICQNIVFLKMKIDSAIAKDEYNKNGCILKETSKAIANVLGDLQYVTNDLGSNLLYGLGLKSALKEWISREIENKHQVVVNFTCDEDYHNLNDDLKNFLFRAIKELLINVVKHAHAKNIEVSLKRNEKFIIANVVDDGIGLKDAENKVPADYKKSGYGLFKTREKLHYLGGNINFIRKNEPGTRVEITVPVDENKK
ncbi:MAG TPA: PAS domain S-box protein [Sedimentisphaerales bacterium]|nr:PAS domain S-box protein [Sedimentisphaerales bacterium]